jgi:hypothetical protein
LGLGDGIGIANDKETLCIPHEVTVAQIQLVVVKYMREHPEKLHQDAGVIAGDALISAFGCKNSN